MSASVSTVRRQGLSHMDTLREALATRCVCEGRAIPGWCEILTTNGFDVNRYFASLRALFEGGGGKGLNHFYVGDPSTGKTALTRPLLALFAKGGIRKAPGAHEFRVVWPHRGQGRDLERVSLAIAAARVGGSPQPL